MTKEELRRIRLAAAYKEMQSIEDNDFLTWEAIKGEVPYIEEYLLHISIRTYSGPNEVMERCDVKITFPRAYPQQAPFVQMVSQPPFFHPHWWADGKYDPGCWHVGERFDSFIIRMLDTMKYEHYQIDVDSYSNLSACKWYVDNKDNEDLFPSDKRELTGIFKKRYIIKSESD